jgi:hypothetical protein
MRRPRGGKLLILSAFCDSFSRHAGGTTSIHGAYALIIER